ncbi:hypothetical protein [uncultured Streptomyces sp.]|uniref:hypothetical protein n=1 Tax=uncultured Streptomyces sp. TaxID=174707 RepID=UPI00262860D5|nr:hypothetical protein [uncultured Streptomyces sp.]
MSDTREGRGTTAGPRTACPECAAIDRAEREATDARDHSLATDWRVRRKRHHDADHREPDHLKPDHPEPDHVTPDHPAPDAPGPAV